MTQEKEPESERLSSTFRSFTGCRGHPCRGSVKPAEGFTLSDFPFPLRSPSPDMDLSGCYHLRGVAMPESKITLEQVRHVALLARLELSPQDEDRLRSDMDEMLAYVDKLNELDTKNIAPTTQVGEAGTPMRDDEVTNRPDADAILANAPSRDRNYFKVPKIIE